MVGTRIPSQIGHGRLETRGPIGFVGVVQLLHDVLGKDAEDTAHVGVARPFETLLHGLDCVLHDAQVGLHLGHDQGALYLYDDMCTVGHHGLVDLGSGCRSQRSRIELSKRLHSRAYQVPSRQHSMLLPRGRARHRSATFPTQCAIREAALRSDSIPSDPI